ncbi:MAG: ATP-binding protein [Pseudomonadota bacterium]
MDRRNPDSIQELISRVAELEELLESAQDFAAAAGDWFWESDAEGRFSYFSPHFETSFGEPSDPYIGKTRKEVALRFYDVEAATEQIALIEQRKPFRDLQFLRKTAAGDLVWARASGVPRYDSNGEFIGYRGAGSNVTEFITVSQRRDELVTLVDDAPFGVVVYDRNMRVKIVNRRLREAMEGVFGPIEVGTPFQGSLRTAIDNGSIDPSPLTADAWIDERVNTVQAKPTAIERKIGDKWSEIRSEPLPDGSVLLYEVDITERRRLQEQLTHRQRIESIGRLTAGVAHDFNNLLAVIMGNLELVDRDAVHPETHELIDEALEATRKGAGLTRQLLAFGRKSTLMPEALDASTIIRDMLGMIRRTLPATIALDTELSSRLKLSRIDRGQLEQALLNLVLNARDAIPSGGRITIRTERVRLDPEYQGTEGAIVEPGCFVMIEVEDDGSGMDAETLEKAFEPFFTTKPPGEGSGLGLSMVIGFAQQSGGDAKIISDLGQGTRVRLYFPASDQLFLPDGTPVAAPEVSVEAKRHVLLVEDDTAVRTVMAKNLRQMGFIVSEAQDGENGLARFKALSDISLLISDAVMPGSLQGPELIERCREIDPDLRALLISGYPVLPGDEAQDEDRAAKIIMKPVPRRVLEREVMELLA